jgi:Zn-dependent protease
MKSAIELVSWAISWWPLVAAITGSIWWSVRAARRKDKRAVLGAALALALATQFAPVSFAAERHQKRKLSVALRRELPEAAAVAGSPAADWINATLAAQVTKPFHVIVDGVEVLARKQSNQNPTAALRELLGVEPTLIPSSPIGGALGGVLGCTDLVGPSAEVTLNSTNRVRCGWADYGSVGYLLPIRNQSLAELSKAAPAARSRVEVRHDGYSPFRNALLSAVFIGAAALAIIASLILHELGHALAAWFVGTRVNVLCIGAGRTLFERTIRGTQCIVRIRPIGGFVQTQARTSKGYRWKSCVVWAAGPGTNALLAFVGSRIFGLGSVAVLCNIAMCAFNLLPFSKFIPEIGRRIGTDGYQIIQFATRRRSYEELPGDNVVLDPAGTPGWFRFAML